ncbi:MAG: rhodanese-like domain-containing protein [Acidobacteriota bacterium]
MSSLLYKKEDRLEITTQQLKRRLAVNADIVIVDVRELVEAQKYRLPNSILIPLGQLQQRMYEIDQKSEVIVYCAAGFRSAKAVKLLDQAGFSNVKNLVGGAQAWQKEIDLGVSISRLLDLLSLTEVRRFLGVATNIKPLLAPRNWATCQSRIPKVDASQASPTTSPQHPATLSPSAVPGKELKVFLYLAGLILCASLSRTTPYQTFKEPRCLFPVRLVGTEPGLDSHPYWTSAILLLSSIFHNLFMASRPLRFFIYAIQLRSFQIAFPIK